MTSPHRSIGILSAFLALSTSACFYPADRGQALEAKVNRLTDDNAQLQAELKAERERLASKIDQKVAEVGKALETLDAASKRSGADIGVALQKNIEDVAQLRGQVDSYLHSIEELQTRIQSIQDATDQKLTALGGADAVKAAESKKRAEEVQRPTDKREFLALADSKTKSGDTAVGRTLFLEFLKKWPRDELAGDAHFGLGETYFEDDHCREALAEYGKVVQDFPRAKSAPNAYLRSADCFRTLKMYNESKLALEELQKSYPRSEAARSAKGKLVELEKLKKNAGSGKKPSPKK